MANSQDLRGHAARALRLASESTNVVVRDNLECLADKYSAQAEEADRQKSATN
jgi:hypothetical protein